MSLSGSWVSQRTQRVNWTMVRGPFFPTCTPEVQTKGRNKGRLEAWRISHRYIRVVEEYTGLWCKRRTASMPTSLYVGIGPIRHLIMQIGQRRIHGVYLHPFFDCGPRI